MKSRSAQTLLEHLSQLNEPHIDFVTELHGSSDRSLHLRPRPKSWNCLECVAHLVYYGKYYMPEIRKSISRHGHYEASDVFKGSLLGHYFARSMKAGPSSRKVKTFRKADFIGKDLHRGVIETFETQLYELRELLSLAKDVNLVKSRTGISIAPIIKLRLGDTLQVVVYHNDRHVQQARRAMSSDI